MSLEKLIRRPVETLPPTASCAEAARLMRDQNIGSVVVVQNGAPVGVVTDRDLALRIVADEHDPAELSLEQVMSHDTIFLSQNRELQDVVETMRDLGVRRLPIVDDEGRLSGIVSMDDVLALLAQDIGALGEAIQREIRVVGE